MRRARGTRTTRDPYARRSLVALVLYLLAFVAVVVRLVDVQVVNAEHYADQGLRQRTRTVELPATRGRVYDREGEVLATSIHSATIYADPRAYLSEERQINGRNVTIPPVVSAEEAAGQLAPLLQREPAWVAEQLRKDLHFVYLGRQLDWEVGDRVLALGLPGVGRLVEPQRVYPGSRLAGQVVGFTGIDGDGLHGLELQHDVLLRGSPGQLAYERAENGLVIPAGLRELVPASPGTDLVLTVDRQIQHVAEQAALEAVREFNAVGAGVVVLEVSTGDVLAMASVPGFDPNDLSTSTPDQRRNRTVTDVFEPGSVQKAVTAAAALEERVVTPETVLQVPDTIRVGNKTFSDAHEHATQPMTFAEIIEASSNVGTIMVAQQLGEQRLARYLDEFGYGRRLGVGFPGEAGGLVLPVDSWWSTSLPTIAIGQGVAVTLLQAASFYATIANDGIATQPRIVRGTVGADGRLAPAQPAEQRTVLRKDTSAAMREILARVVGGERGTGKRAGLSAYRVAGKTGTARKPSPDARGYSGEYVATFVGFAPAEDPEIVVAVMVDEPRPIWGGVVAAPVFAEVMDFALTHRNVAPSASREDLEAAFDRAHLRAELIAAERAAQSEGPATDAEAPGSPPVGTPSGGDGQPVVGTGAAPAAPSG
ncbi:MAG TPA: penicillin-binding protein 2 [Nitriliruptorales bacterium]